VNGVWSSIKERLHPFDDPAGQLFLWTKKKTFQQLLQSLIIMPPLFSSEDVWLPVEVEASNTFLWPKHAARLIHRQYPTLDDALKNTLEECGILKKDALEEKDRGERLEVAAMKSGRLVGKREIFITFDTFLARSRPGLGEKEGADSTNKKKKNKKKKKKKKAAAAAAAAEESEPKKWTEENKENLSLKTLGWSNPAWAPRSMEGSKKTPATKQPEEGSQKFGWKNQALAPTFSRLLKQTPGQEGFGRTA